MCKYVLCLSTDPSVQVALWLYWRLPPLWWGKIFLPLRSCSLIPALFIKHSIYYFTHGSPACLLASVFAEAQRLFLRYPQQMSKINSPAECDHEGARLMAKLKWQPFVLPHCCAAKRGELTFSPEVLLPFPAGRTEVYSMQTLFGVFECAIWSQAVLTPVSTECLWSSAVSHCCVCWCVSHYSVCFLTNSWSRGKRRYLPYNNILKLFLHEIGLFLFISVLDNFAYCSGYVAFVVLGVPWLAQQPKLIVKYYKRYLAKNSSRSVLQLKA